MKTFCGVDCNKCEYNKNKLCKGCVETKGCPFGKQCFIAKYIMIGGMEKYDELKRMLIDEFNSLNICGMPKITNLIPLNGGLVNLKYRLPNKKEIQFLEDDNIYLGTQVECKFNEEDDVRYFGLVASLDFLLVCEYGINTENPELIIYKKR